MRYSFILLMWAVCMVLMLLAGLADYFFLLGQKLPEGYLKQFLTGILLISYGCALVVATKYQAQRDYERSKEGSSCENTSSATARPTDQTSSSS